MSREAFEHYANFGSGMHGGDVLDTAKFAKLCKETKLVDGVRCTTTDIDLVFKKVLPKGERKMTFEFFMDALQLIGAKKFPQAGSTNEQLAQIEAHLNRNRPKGAGSGPINDITARLTDTSQYTGSHKHRFDEDGRGRGRDGRDVAAKGPGHIASNQMRGETEDLSQMLRQNLNSGPKFQTTQAPLHSYGHNTFNSPPDVSGLHLGRSPQAVPPPPAVSPGRSSGSGPSSGVVRPSSGRTGVDPRAGLSSRDGQAMRQMDQHLFNKIDRPTSGRASGSGPSGGGGGGSVFSRLTDHKQYTGAHKHRFDSTGHGRGAEGRDTGAIGHGTNVNYRGGAVSDLSQITRSHFN